MANTTEDKINDYKVQLFDVIEQQSIFNGRLQELEKQKGELVQALSMLRKQLTEEEADDDDEEVEVDKASGTPKRKRRAV